MPTFDMLRAVRVYPLSLTVTVTFYYPGTQAMFTTHVSGVITSTRSVCGDKITRFYLCCRLFAVHNWRKQRFGKKLLCCVIN